MAVFQFANDHVACNWPLVHHNNWTASFFGSTWTTLSTVGKFPPFEENRLHALIRKELQICRYGPKLHLKTFMESTRNSVYLSHFWRRFDWSISGCTKKFPVSRGGKVHSTYHVPSQEWSIQDMWEKRSLRMTKNGHLIGIWHKICISFLLRRNSWRSNVLFDLLHNAKIQMDTITFIIGFNKEVL